MTMTDATKQRGRTGRGKYPMEYIRPTAFDLAALHVLTNKYNGTKAGVWRLGLARLVDFECVREQVTDLAAQYE